MTKARVIQPEDLLAPIKETITNKVGLDIDSDTLEVTTSGQLKVKDLGVGTNVLKVLGDYPNEIVGTYTEEFATLGKGIWLLHVQARQLDATPPQRDDTEFKLTGTGVSMHPAFIGEKTHDTTKIRRDSASTTGVGILTSDTVVSLVATCSNSFRGMVYCTAIKIS